MSRTPIKHALLKLESDGLIEKSSKSSSFRVAEITTDTIRELFDFREAIETSAYTLAWKNSNFGCMKSELRKYTECMQVAIGNSSLMHMLLEKGLKQLCIYSLLLLCCESIAFRTIKVCDIYIISIVNIAQISPSKFMKNDHTSFHRQRRRCEIRTVNSAGLHNIL